MAGAQFIELEGRKVLLISMANCGQAELLSVMEAARKLIISQPPKSLITITQVEGAHYSPVTVKAVTEFAAQNESYVKVGIVVGVSGIRKAIFDAVVKQTQRRLLAFETMDQARAWLVKHLFTAEERAVGAGNAL